MNEKNDLQNKTPVISSFAISSLIVQTNFKRASLVIKSLMMTGELNKICSALWYKIRSSLNFDMALAVIEKSQIYAFDMLVKYYFYTRKKV